jgi:DNA modification methylase
LPKANSQKPIFKSSNPQITQMKILQGDCLQLMKTLPDNSVDSIVTDPPYGLSFMGKKWDYDVPSQEIWEECLRILKPGGHLLAFAGTRTQHRMAVRIEDAGFEIRDMIAWVYGSGFPKSLNVGKAVDKLQGNEREVVGEKERGDVQKAKEKGVGYLADIANKNNIKQFGYGTEIVTKGTSEFEGWGTALKPALEPITLARKPLSKNTVAENVLKWGTGGLNIDGSRVETEDTITNHSRGEESAISKGKYGDSAAQETFQTNGQAQGRFPANFIHDGSDEVLSLFPKQAGAAAPVKSGQSGKSNGIYSDFANKGDDGKSFRNDSGSAARFFYCAKASKSERNAGCEDLTEKNVGFSGGANGQLNKGNDSYLQDSIGLNRVHKMKNNHPTVKPIALIRYLIKLVTPKNGIVLDPFGGSGTTAVATIEEGFDCIIMEKEPEYINIINARVSNAQSSNPQIFKSSNPQILK